MCPSQIQPNKTFRCVPYKYSPIRRFDVPVTNKSVLSLVLQHLDASQAAGKKCTPINTLSLGSPADGSSCAYFNFPFRVICRLWTQPSASWTHGKAGRTAVWSGILLHAGIIPHAGQGLTTAVSLPPLKIMYGTILNLRRPVVTIQATCCNI
jgi:hypothetical protein